MVVIFRFLVSFRAVEPYGIPATLTHVGLIATTDVSANNYMHAGRECSVLISVKVQTKANSCCRAGASSGA